jgi:hypothetical protein
MRIVGRDIRVPLVVLARLAGGRRHFALRHLIAKKDLLPIPRPGRHSHFSVRLTLDNKCGLIAGREFSENFCELLCSHKSFCPDHNRAEASDSTNRGLTVMRFRRCHSRRIIILAIRSRSQGRAVEERTTGSLPITEQGHARSCKPIPRRQ